MFRTILILYFFISLLNAGIFDFDVDFDKLRYRFEAVETKVEFFKKVIFLDKDYRKKLHSNRVIIMIIYDSDSHKKLAKRYVKALDGSSYDDYMISVITDSYQIKKIVPTAYLLIVNDFNAKTLAERLVEKKRVIFSVFSDQIKSCTATVNGVLMKGLVINISMVKRGGIRFKDELFKIATKWEDDDE